MRCCKYFISPGQEEEGTKKKKKKKSFWSERREKTDQSTKVLYEKVSVDEPIGYRPELSVDLTSTEEEEEECCVCVELWVSHLIHVPVAIYITRCKVLRSGQSTHVPHRAYSHFVDLTRSK